MVQEKHLKVISRVYQESFKVVSRKIKGCVEVTLSVFQESFKGISKKVKGRVFQGN